MSLTLFRCRTTRAAVLVPFACLALYGCPSEESADDDEAGTPSGYEDVIYQGGTTDEALVAFVAALDQGAPQPDTSQAPLLVSPMAGDLPSDPTPTFNWNLGSSASAKAAGDASRFAGAWPNPARASTAPSFGAALAQLLGGVRSAHAHGDPFNGYGVFLTISSSSDPKLCRVFTGATSYTPTTEVWQKIATAGEVTVALVGAAFENNRIPQGSGPFLGSTTTLTISPVMP